MSNTFVNTSLVVRDASIILEDIMLMAQLSNRNHEDQFGGKVGDSISIKVPPQQTARDFIDDSSSVTDNNITETSVSLQLSEQPYVAHTLTTKEKSLELDDFNTVVTEPAMIAIKDAGDAYIFKKGLNGFGRYLAGTDGNNPSTWAHLLAGRKLLQDNGCPLENRVAVMNTTAEASYLQLAQVSSVDYGEDRPMAMREAIIGKISGVTMFATQNAIAASRGDIANATDGVSGVIGSTTIVLDDNAGGSTGTITDGSRFTVAGDSTVYTVLGDTTASGGVFTLTVGPAVVATVDDGDNITWKSAATGNIVYVPNALAAAIVPPAPLAVGSSVAFMNGVGVRTTVSSSTSSLSDQIVFDTYVGAKVIERKGGAVFQG